jgi:hypothetical protein
MRRGVRSVFGGAFVALLVGVGAAPGGAAPGASVEPASGTLTCGVSATGQFSPALPSASNEDGSAGRLKFKLKGVLANCDNSGVTGGKMPITGGTFQFSASLDEGSGCGDISAFDAPDFTSEVAKLSIKLTGTTPTGKHPKVASLSVRSDGFSNDVIPKGWEIDSDSFPSERASAAFPDASAVFSLIFDAATLGNAGSCSLGGPDLRQVVFGTGSTVEIS